MVNKFFVCFFLMIAFVLQNSAYAASNIGDISGNQQSMLMLKSALERAKLEKQLSDMKDVKVPTSELCPGKGIGMLSLKAVYGVGKKRYASFYYNTSSTMEAQVGDTLLCGEQVSVIRLDKVEVVKDGVKYSVSGSSHAVTKNQQE